MSSSFRKLTTSAKSLGLHRINNSQSSHHIGCRGLCMEVGADSNKGPIQCVIEKKLTENFQPLHLSVENESHKHAVPRGSESHFKVVVVSEHFTGRSLLQRHRSVNQALSEELSTSVHALAIHAKTPAQWQNSPAVADSPDCLGGSKFEQRQRNKPRVE